MPRTLKIAPVQMDGTPAPLTERLERAAGLIAQAAAAGAQLVVLPEVFNTGYEYSDANYPLAEPLDGPTVTWMKAQAAQHQIHLAGSLMVLDDEDIYNAALIIAPDGRRWRYDKNYPWAWERAYFRDSDRITIAETDLGRIGLMICHDYNHAELWERYAGKIDLLLVISAPPRLYDFDLIFPDGYRLNVNEAIHHLPLFYAAGTQPWREDFEQHAAWLRVPVVNTMQSGTFRTKVPVPQITLSPFLMLRPDLWGRLLHQADAVVIETGYDLETKVVDATGQVLARVTEPGEGFTVAEVTLPDERPVPGYAQPKFNMRAFTYFLEDWLGPALMIPKYRQMVRQQWGQHMAPVSARTHMWLVAVLTAGIVGWFLGSERKHDVGGE